MPLSCPFCAAQMPATAAFCPGCGVSMDAPKRATGNVGILPIRLAGALAYVTFIPAIVFLVLKPYNKNVFTRFHSIQCLACWGAALLVAALLKLLSYLLFLIPIAGPLLVFVSVVIAILATIFLWLALEVKAFQGEMFEVPFVGGFAQQFAKSL